VIDTSPASWARLSTTLPFHSVVQTLLVFINAHLAINHSNQVAVLASHVNKVAWLYPTPEPTAHKDGAAGTNGVDSGHDNRSNKYRPFQVMEEQVRSNLKKLLDSTPESASALSSPPLLSGALSMALAHANMQSLLASPAALLSDPADDKLMAPGAADLDAHTNAMRSTLSSASLTARILVLSVSEADLSSQYVGLMNAVFAAQRMAVPVDMLRIGPQAAFLQQASDATGGVFMNYDPMDAKDAAVNGNGKHEEDEDEEMDDEEDEGNVQNAAAMGLLQTLMMGYLPDVTARRNLVMPGSEEVDFRAACFCHGKIVDLGGVCSVCLSSKFMLVVLFSTF
jgi:transcription initiation factor TFIIH subunit 3